ncbi:MAG TPA: ABC transporter permease [Chloroflexota bacterium]|nr:ABC transporter permease [Chloroflexota bacterium]
MISLRSLLPPQAPRSAFGNLVKDEFRLAWRTRTGLVAGLGLPLLLLVVFGSLPGAGQPQESLGDLTVLDVYLPVIIAFSITALGLVVMPQALATYREQGILRRLSTTPVPPAWVLGAQMVVNVSLVVLALLLLMVGAAVGFSVAAPRSLVGFVLAMLLSIAAIFGIGIVIAAISRGATMAQAIGGALFFPLLFFGGMWLPRAAMPVVLRDVSNLTPLGAAVEAIQSAMQTGFPPVTSLLVLVAYAVVFWWLALRVFRWE